jgi:multiple sugar transport system substrate-binding protein
MDEIELSTMERRLSNRQVLQNLLENFESQHGVRTQHQMLDWTRGRSELIKVALYHHGPDISEVGTTWISDLIAMNALRPFSAGEVEHLAPAGSFLPESWKTARLTGSDQVWSIPWLAETLILYYHRDLLEESGIDPAGAFDTLDTLHETVGRLSANGYALPIAVPPPNDRTMLLHAASTWVWEAGGSYITDDGKTITFNSEETTAGIMSFLRLLLNIPPEGIALLEKLGVAGSFHQKQAPIAIAGAWLAPDSSKERSLLGSNLGVARLPGHAFVGGSNLVMWKHTRQERPALSLIHYLTDPLRSGIYGRASGILSARSQSLIASELENDLILTTMLESIRDGQSFPTVPLWGLVEDRLAMTLSTLWQALSNSSSLDVDETVIHSLNQAARSLSLTLSQQ